MIFPFLVFHPNIAFLRVYKTRESKKCAIWRFAVSGTMQQFSHTRSMLRPVANAPFLQLIQISHFLSAFHWCNSVKVKTTIWRFAVSGTMQQFSHTISMLRPVANAPSLQLIQISHFLSAFHQCNSEQVWVCYLANNFGKFKAHK